MTETPDTHDGMDLAAATAWLLAELADGPKPAADIAIAAKAAKIRRATLRTARQRLGAETIHTDTDMWIVALPAAAAVLKAEAWEAAKVKAAETRADRAAQIEADAVAAAIDARAHGK